MNAKTDHFIAGWWQRRTADLRRWSLHRASPWQRARLFCAALMLGALTAGFSGCVAPYPDYSPYYSDYGYSGVGYPFGGFGGDIFVGGGRHHGYYGGHHFGHDFHGGGHGYHGGGSHGGGHHH